MGLREPTRVNKLRDSGSTQNLLSQGFKFKRNYRLIIIIPIIQKYLQ